MSLRVLGVSAALLVATTFPPIPHPLVAGTNESLKSFGVLELDTRECLLRQPITASELSVQLYVIPALGGGLQPLADYTFTVTPARGQDRAVNTDKMGYVRIPLSPGAYRLHVPYVVLDPLSQDVIIAPSGPRRTIAAIANVACGKVCVVPFQRQPAKSAPPCLFKPEIGSVSNASEGRGRE
jgi:hypothetical protein